MGEVPFPARRAMQRAVWDELVQPRAELTTFTDSALVAETCAGALTAAGWEVVAMGEPNEHEQPWAGMWKLAQDRYEAVSLGVWRLIADGGSLSDVANLVAQVADANDWCDETTTAAFEAAVAVAGRCPLCNDEGVQHDIGGVMRGLCECMKRVNHALDFAASPTPHPTEGTT